jgi:hypothetical protein
MHSTGHRATFLALAITVAATAPAHAQSMANDKAMAGKNMTGDKMMMSPTGTFKGVKNHPASGSYAVVGTGKDRKLEFGDNFKMEAAPDVYVVLAKGMMAKDAGSLELGKLKKSEGRQSVAIPESANLANYTTVLLWSKKDNMVMGEAALGDHGAMGSMDHGSMDKGTMMDKPAMMKDTGMMMKKP